jgi:hypothetical protein
VCGILKCMCVLPEMGTASSAWPEAWRALAPIQRDRHGVLNWRKGSWNTLSAVGTFPGQYAEGSRQNRPLSLMVNKGRHTIDAQHDVTFSLLSESPEPKYSYRCKYIKRYIYVRAKPCRRHTLPYQRTYMAYNNGNALARRSPTQGCRAESKR